MCKPMTRMSVSSHPLPPHPDHNRLQSWGRSCLARTVHVACTIVGISVLIASITGCLAGCVIPPSLSVDIQDAGVNSPPAILSVTSDSQALPEPGPVVFDMGATAGDLSISLIDTDALDQLYVRIFVDYNTPNRLDARARCLAPPSPNPMRTATCTLNSLCVTDDLGHSRNMS